MAESTSRPTAGVRSTSDRRMRSSLDDLFDDIGDLPSSSVSGSKSKQSSACTSMHTTQSSSGGAVAGKPLSKCMGLMLGGTHRQRGRNGSSVGTVLCCDSLRCTKCDFKVIWFQGKVWDSGVDYLFFRNNFPTESKLAPMLLGMPDACAYCCQCTWQSISADVVVDYGSELRWVCAGHRTSPGL
ncbi:hypothetical protein CEUSTIGMA_g5893.t1 [Chlamydomonas eustigma]|uniref:Cilia- and flagella-associated protein 418 n=1 Tax=Chlamydomonas eustigma TaxID=1157962 RepID=A0A250X5V1_9CHLO|nr:hypothetical protein CEUSTIGMA_g5893.t1 [Chlamydomonas eustigma]|eukprot:GAX78453.1 hypothetical protein CEUSTIGMA_g5893.t1 [Chlamydomonas eustigma]